MSYKQVDSIIANREDRRTRVLNEIIQSRSSSGETNSECYEYKKGEVVAHNESTFCLDKFLEIHPTMTYESFTNFSSEELDELVHVINEKLGTSHRGKKIKCSTKGCLFLTLSYYSSYMPLTNLAEIAGIKVPTLERIIKKVTNTYFPIFISKFIPKSIPTCHTLFKNYPSAVGAIDSSTIKFYIPPTKQMQHDTWDGKNRINWIKLQALVNPAGIAIHICTDYLAGTHDKRIYDLSEVTSFVTVKRGVENVPLPVLADKGYIGIEKYHTTAIVQQKGHDEETIKRNNFIAMDRQIVERFFGRFKTSWGAMADGFRGDRDTIPLIIKGLVALTNYNINLHPLNKDDGVPDDFQIETKENTSADTYLSPENGSAGIVLANGLTKKDTSAHYRLNSTYKYIGIQNQGATCHINAVLEVMFMIKPLVNLVSEARYRSSFSRELSLIFDAMKSSQDNSTPKKYAITTKLLTKQIGLKWIAMQDSVDTYEFFMKKISQSLSSTKKEYINEIFSTKCIVKHKVTQKSYTENWLVFSLYIQFDDVLIALETQRAAMEMFYPPPILVIQICRAVEKAETNQFQKRYAFPLTLDISSISNNDNNKYELFSIIAYASLHMITFNKINDQWYVFDDENVYQCNEDMIQFLYGGVDNNPLWDLTSGIKWVAKMLFYREIHFNINE